MNKPLIEHEHRTVKTHGLSLIPIIAVGHAEGADLAAQLALKHGSPLGACILLSPTAWATPVLSGALDGIHILTASEESPGSVGRQVCDVLEKAGATVICERVPPRRTSGPHETAIARVFVAALFGDDWPRHDPKEQSDGGPND